MIQYRNGASTWWFSPLTALILIVGVFLALAVRTARQELSSPTFPAGSTVSTAVVDGRFFLYIGERSGGLPLKDLVKARRAFGVVYLDTTGRVLVVPSQAISPAVWLQLKAAAMVEKGLLRTTP